MADRPTMSNSEDPENKIRADSNELQLPMEYAGYCLLELIGKGGSGKVYRARKIGEVQKDVAIKIPNPKSRALVEREYYRSKNLEHPNVLPATGCSQSHSSEPYLITDYMPKGNLANQLWPTGKGKPNHIPISTIIKWSTQIASALSYLHQPDIDIFHRDIKPENILVDEENNIRIADFGLCRVGHHDSLCKEQSRDTIGTPIYMPPEVIKGMAPDKISDLYCFGITMHTILTATQPFDKFDNDALRKEAIAKGNVESIRKQRCDAPIKLCKIISQCMDPDRDNRFPSADRLLCALKEFDKEENLWFWFYMHWTWGVQRFAQWTAIVIGLLCAGWAANSFFQPQPLPVVQTEPAPPPPSGPRLELVREFRIPDSFKQFRMFKPCQWFLDDSEELAFVSESEVAIFTSKGEELNRISGAPLNFHKQNNGTMFQDINGDGLDELFVCGNIEKMLQAQIYNQNVLLLKTFDTKGRYSPEAKSVLDSVNSFLTAEKWEDIDGDGNPEFFAIIHTGHLLQPRALLCFDGLTGKLKWRWGTGGEIYQVLTQDLDSDGIKEILVSCASVANGSVGPDNRRDVFSIVGALNSNGEELWIKRVNGPMNYPWIHPLYNGNYLVSFVSDQSPLEINQPAQFQWLDLESMSFETVLENAIPQNGLMVLDKTGKTLQQLFIKESISSIKTINELAADQRILIHATDGHVLLLNDTLDKILLAYQFKRSADETLEMSGSLIDLKDLVGDSKPELVFLIAEGIRHHDNWKSDPSEQPTQDTFTDHRIEIFDSELTPLITHSLPVEKETTRGHRVELLDADGDGRDEIATLKEDLLQIYKPILE